MAGIDPSQCSDKAPLWRKARPCGARQLSLPVRQVRHFTASRNYRRDVDEQINEFVFNLTICAKTEASACSHPAVFHRREHRRRVLLPYRCRGIEKKG